MHIHCDICVMKLWVLQYIVWGFFPFLRQFWLAHFDLPAKVLKALTHTYFTIIWLIPLKSWALPVSVEQSMGIGRMSKYLWEYWQEFFTTGRYQGLGEDGQTLEQGVERLWHPHSWKHPAHGAICCSCPCSERTIFTDAHSAMMWFVGALEPKWD